MHLCANKTIKVKKITYAFFIVLLAIACKNEISKPRVFQPELAKQLQAMAELDQVAAYIPQGNYKEWTKEKWNRFKDSIFTTHERMVKNMFTTYGYLGFDLVGEEGESNFWVMVQHCDHDPVFQKNVLEALAKEVQKKNAKPSHLALLTDRVNINTGKNQIYGTQMNYRENGQAYAFNLQDSLTVDQRRAALNMEPLKEYLNRMTLGHFEMNKQYFVSQGITKPNLYQ